MHAGKLFSGFYALFGIPLFVYQARLRSLIALLITS